MTKNRAGFATDQEYSKQICEPRFEKLPEIDCIMSNLQNRLNFDSGKMNEIHPHSLKKQLKSSKIAKLGSKMLEDMEIYPCARKFHV